MSPHPSHLELEKPAAARQLTKEPHAEKGTQAGVDGEMGFQQPPSPQWSMPRSSTASPVDVGMPEKQVAVKATWQSRLAAGLGAVELRDKFLKLFVYLVRLTRHFEALIPLGYDRPLMDTRLKVLDKQVVDARQLLNHFGYLETGKVFLELLQARDMDAVKRAMLLVRTSFWTLEQCSSDAGYYAKHLFHSWDPAVPAYYYRLGKSISLTILILVDLREIARSYAKLREARAQDGAQAVAQREELAKHIRKLVLGIVRCVCDCVIYYTWLPQYKPNKGFTLLCGLLSATVGTYLQVKKYV